MRRLSLLLLAFPALFLVSCDDPPDPPPPDPTLCDGDEIRAALGDSLPGGIVTIGACNVVGPFDVPAGVILEGQGDTSVIANGDDGYAVRLIPGATEAQATTLRRVSVFSEGSGPGAVGVYSEGTGFARIDDLLIDVTTGVGLLMANLTRAQLTNLTLTGPLGAAAAMNPVYSRVAPIQPSTDVLPAIPEDCAMMMGPCTSNDRRTDPVGGEIEQFCNECGFWVSITGTEGISLENVADAELTEVEVMAFARHGLVWNAESSSSTLRVSDSTFADNAGTGLRLEGGRVVLTNVTVEGMLASADGARPSVAVDAQRLEGDLMGVSIETTDLSLLNNGGMGMLQTIPGTHTRLIADTNESAALWVGGVDGLELLSSTFTNNALIGVMISESSNVLIQDTTISGTRMASIVRMGVELQFGDGLQIFDSLTMVETMNVTLENNWRVQLLYDMGEGTVASDWDACASGDGVCLLSTTVTGGGTSLGAIAMHERISLGGSSWTGRNVGSGLWDQNITRNGTDVIDETATDLNLTGAVIPFQTPVPSNLRGAVIPFM